ncbi:EexN family lipoprotein [Sulfurospirillum cavolei]|uniref:EexN family lipoprotein n=1 Tax=Sulfurospirillum cavolei TaxID=366522 RepID=UPI0007649239|nr:EexN family lipoprotein [Sulfurospirillum cavolei]
MKTILLGLLSLSALILLTGCGEDAKTKEYYDAHLEEAKIRVQECKKLEKSNEMQERECQNAQQAIFDNKQNRKNIYDTNENMQDFVRKPTENPYKQ